MSDTGGFPLVGGSPAFPGKNNVVRDGPGSNSFGWENLAVGNLSIVSGYRNKVTGNLATAIGNGNTSSAFGSITAGSSNIASATASVAVGSTNTSSSFASFSAGSSNVSSGTTSLSFGTSCTASGQYSLSGGIVCTSSGPQAFSFGSSNTASGENSIALGSYCLASRFGEFAIGLYGQTSSGLFQHGWLGLSKQTTDATPANLWLNGSGASQRAVLAAGARWKCTLEIMAATTGAIDKSASWEYKFQIDRPTTAATTIIRTTPLLTLSDGSNAGAPPVGWSVAITADTTNGCPQIQVTGDTDTINWTAALHYVQSIRV